MQNQNQTIPSPISGNALIDTGATHTSIDDAIAQQAGLAVTGTATMSSATHAHQTVNTYAGIIDFVGMAGTVTCNRAQGVNLQTHGIIALLGRDVLEHCLLVYNGQDGSFSLSV